MATMASYWWLWLIIGIVAIIILLVSGVIKDIKNAFSTVDKNCINPENHSAIVIKIVLAIITVGAWILFFISMGVHSRKNFKNNTKT